MKEIIGCAVFAAEKMASNFDHTCHLCHAGFAGDFAADSSADGKIYRRLIYISV